MKIKVSNIEFNSMNGKMIIFIQSDEILKDKIKLCFIERRLGAGNKLFKPKKIFYNLEVNNNELVTQIYLSDQFPSGYTSAHSSLPSNNFLFLGTF